MSRRRFGHIVAGIVVASASPVFAQASKVVRRIGLLDVGIPLTPDQIQEYSDAFREFGWVEGRNLHIEWRFANNKADALQALAEELQALAEELVRANVEVIVTKGTPATLAAKRATTSVPIVFAIGDPVQFGVVASLARPGGNATGYSQAKRETSAKYLSLLKELLPTIRRVGVLEYSANPFFRATRGQFGDSCRLLGMEPIFVEIVSADEIESVISQLRRQRAEALILRGDSFIYDHRFEIGSATLKHRLPTMSEMPDLVREAGILAAYTPARSEENRRVASYVDRILRGAKPADLPVEQPQKFELVINLKTARALGLTIPKELLLRADEVLQ
jgi:putative ABC transport system substrate-binding protein